MVAFDEKTLNELVMKGLGKVSTKSLVDNMLKKIEDIRSIKPEGIKKNGKRL